MGNNTSIEWTATVLEDGTVVPGATFNPWWGCLKVSAECEHCYAETFAYRYGHEVWGPAKTTNRRFFGDKHWASPVKWNHEAEKTGIRRKVFCASMADVYEDNPQLEVERLRLFNLIRSTPGLDWLLLTKRPENILRLSPEQWKHSPLPNLWLGTSIGVNSTVDRIFKLIECRGIAKVLFLSCEPLLENIYIPSIEKIDWVIVGGESGPKKRKFNTNWARTIRDHCALNNVPFFFKQIDKVIDKVQGIPEDLMIRQFPRP